MTTTLDSLARGEVDKQLYALKSRLAAEYGDNRAYQLVDEEHGRFAGARVRTFLPILIERSVRARLRR
ncbi:MAG TPA: hypothetical protein VGP26_03875 [Actinophytocola sp.]|nr:hypothetical protein [Actinophytocola sp.]